MAQYLFLVLYFLTAVSMGQFRQFSIDSLCANKFMLIVRLDSIEQWLSSVLPWKTLGVTRISELLSLLLFNSHPNCSFSKMWWCDRKKVKKHCRRAWNIKVGRVGHNSVDEIKQCLLCLTLGTGSFVPCTSLLIKLTMLHCLFRLLLQKWLPWALCDIHMDKGPNMFHPKRTNWK